MMPVYSSVVSSVVFYDVDFSSLESTLEEVSLDLEAGAGILEDFERILGFASDVEGVVRARSVGGLLRGVEGLSGAVGLTSFSSDVSAALSAVQGAVREARRLESVYEGGVLGLAVLGLREAARLEGIPGFVVGLVSSGLSLLSRAVDRDVEVSRGEVFGFLARAVGALGPFIPYIGPALGVGIGLAGFLGGRGVGRGVGRGGVSAADARRALESLLRTVSALRSSMGRVRGGARYSGSGVDGMADGISVVFKDGSRYYWSEGGVGQSSLGEMIDLGARGSGLGSFIYLRVRFRYD